MSVSVRTLHFLNGSDGETTYLKSRLKLSRKYILFIYYGQISAIEKTLKYKSCLDFSEKDPLRLKQLARTL